MKKLSINRRDSLSLIAAGVTGAIGVLLLFFGNDAVFVPMKMAAWLHFGVAALLLLNVLWPAFVRVCERGAKSEKMKRPLRAISAFVLRWSNPFGFVLFLAALGGFGFLYWLFSARVSAGNIVGYLHVLVIHSGHYVAI